MRFKFLICSALIGATSLAATEGTATVWNVNPVGTGDAPTIQAAYDLAAPGDQIVLAPGTYTDSNTRTIQGHSTLQTTTAVAFMGPGVDITSSGGAAVTFIDGVDDHHGLFGVDVGAVEVTGITFTRCARAGGEIWGGGMMFHRSSPIIENCRFLDNEAWAGGGILISKGSNAVIRFNVFARNFGGDLGGAVEIFQHNGAVIAFNTFVDNSAGRHGGALLLNTAVTSVHNNIFAGNSAAVSGGGMACLNSHSETGSCNLFWENTSPANPQILACTVFLGANDNIEADPLFCDAATDEYTVYANSPAAEGAGACPMRGALGVGCGTVAVESTTWGAAKALYR